MGVFCKGNRWYLDYYLPDGRRKREVVGHVNRVTRSIAEKALKVRIAEIVQGRFNIESTKKPIVFDHLMEKYLEWAKSHHRRADRDLAASKPLLSFFGGKQIGDLNLWLIEKYKAKRKDEGKKPETVNKELSILRRMFNLAVEWKLITTNPVQGMKPVKIQRYLPRVLTEEEFHKLYQAASPHFKPILLCAYMTGMRRSEIAKLKWEDIDFKRGYIYVKETKNDESRSIPMAKPLLITLAELRKRATGEFVFTTPRGEPYTYITAWKRAWEGALRRSGIGKCRFHDLRHTFVSNLIVGEKEDLATVMELSGHKDIRMLRRYSHTRESAKKTAVEKLGERLNRLFMDTSSDTSPRRDRGEVSVTY
jgi:integrase